MPNFFIIGARRAGTASLAYYLSQHPKINFTEPHDPAFFRIHDLYQRGIDYYIRTYCSFTSGAQQELSQWRGEATSTYFSYPHIVGKRLHNHYADDPPQFIVLLREPVARAWSHYLMNVHHGREKRPFATALEQEHLEAPESDLRYFAEGCYMQLLTEWQAYYPLENFLFILSEDLAANPMAQVRRVFSWLGAGAIPSIDVRTRLNMTPYSNASWIVEFLNHPPAWLSQLGRKFWPEDWRRDRVRSRLRQRFQSTYTSPPPLSPEITVQLRERYRDDIRALSKHLGRYLTHWLSEEGPAPPTSTT